MRVKQHIPSFISGLEPDEREVASLEDLLRLPYVWSWEESPTFKQWECGENSTEPRYLMATMNDGKFWVVAYVWGEGLESLPRWRETQQ